VLALASWLDETNDPAGALFGLPDESFFQPSGKPPPDFLLQQCAFDPSDLVPFVFVPQVEEDYWSLLSRSPPPVAGETNAQSIATWFWEQHDLHGSIPVPPSVSFHVLTNTRYLLTSQLAQVLVTAAKVPTSTKYGALTSTVPKTSTATRYGALTFALYWDKK